MHPETTLVSGCFCMRTAVDPTAALAATKWVSFKSGVPLVL